MAASISKRSWHGRRPAKKLASADEHAVLARVAPLNQDVVLVFASVASHLDGDFTRIDRPAMQ